jgi:SAM-dependent methyltransferase
VAVKKEVVVSELDLHNYKLIRKNIEDFLHRESLALPPRGKLLDIAPQIHLGAAQFFSDWTVETLDIDYLSKANYIADICCDNSNLIPDNTFDIVVCTEVLEHTLHPFNAVKEIYRILKKGGYLLATTPFNFRIHGPLPDCWRFSEHGLKALLNFANFSDFKIEALESKDRDLMPIHYTTKALK